MELEPVEPCYTYDDVPVIFIDFFFTGFLVWVCAVSGSGC